MKATLQSRCNSSFAFNLYFLPQPPWMSYDLNSTFLNWNNFRYKDTSVLRLDGECLCKISSDIALKDLNISL